jgi:hypothetical protein
MTDLGAAALADRIALETSGWSVVSVSGEAVLAQLAKDLEEELHALLEEEGRGRVHVHHAADAPTLLGFLGGLGGDDVAVITATQEVASDIAAMFEHYRGRLVGGPRGVLITPKDAVATYATHAPSFWSWVGASVWGHNPRAGVLDREARLQSLREATGRTDAQVVELAEQGQLPADPIYAEWIALLGRGDLIGA